MALDTWTGSGSGTWSTASDWSNGVPQTGGDVQIETASGISVTFNSGTIALDSLVTSGAALDFTAGSLSTSNGYTFGGPLTLSGGSMQLTAGFYGGTFGGNVTESGGTLTLLNGADALGGSFSETGGTLAIGGGDFLDRDGGTFSGLITGAGRMQFAGYGTTTSIDAGFSANVGSIEVVIGALSFNTSVNYANTFALDSGGTLSLNSNTLTLSGAAGLDGDITGGTLDLKGTGHLNGLLLDNGQLLSLTGTYNETGPIQLGNSGTGTLSIGKTGTLRLTNNNFISVGNGGGVFLNAGTLTKVGGGPVSGESVIYGNFTNASTGIIDVAVGTLDFRGPSNGFTNTLAGTITGAGTMSFDAGSFLISSASNLTLDVARVLLTGNSTAITLTTTQSYGGDWDQTGGTLVVGIPGQAAGTLALGGEAAFDGGLLKGTGTVLSSGPVNLDNNVDLEGNLTFNFSGLVSQTGNINLGVDADAITSASIAQGDSWNLEGGNSIYGFNGEIINNGTFAKLNGAGTSVVQSDVINVGTLAVDSGELTLSGVGTLGGSVIGGGVLDISGAYQFAATLGTLSVGTVILDSPNQTGEVQATLGGDITFANNWDQEGGTLALTDNDTGYTLTLNGVTSLQSGNIEGTGLVIVNGAAVLGANFGLLQGAQVDFNGNTEQTGNVTLTGGSSAPVLSIGTGATYTMDDNATLGGADQTVVGTLVVGGTLVASGAGALANTIGAAVVDNGSIKLSYGEMQFLGGLTGKGSITLSNGATLDLLGSSNITNTITFGHKGGILDLGTPDNFTGTIAGFASGDMVELNGFAFDNITTIVQGDTVTLTEGNQSVTLTFSTAQTATQLTVGEGPHGWLSLIHL
jgi:fibronectin-binding autotransporter adhesin